MRTSETTRTLSPEEQAVAGYKWLTTELIAAEMGSSRQQVINLIRSGAYGSGNVTRWGREYRVRPEAHRAYLERQAAKLQAEIEQSAA